MRQEEVLEYAFVTSDEAQFMLVLALVSLIGATSSLWLRHTPLNRSCRLSPTGGSSQALCIRRVDAASIPTRTYNTRRLRLYLHSFNTTSQPAAIPV